MSWKHTPLLAQVRSYSDYQPVLELMASLGTLSLESPRQHHPVKDNLGLILTMYQLKIMRNQCHNRDFHFNKCQKFFQH
jgi:hypothetical protein